MDPAYHSGTLWALLTAAERRILEAAGTTHYHPAGTRLLSQGDCAGAALILLAGRAKVVAISPTGYESVLAVRRPGDIIGEMSAIDNKPRSATVVAIDGLQVLRIPPAKFNAILGGNPAIAHAVLKVVCARLRSASQRRSEFGGSTVAQRLTAFLAELVAQDGKASGDGITITVPFSQEDIAGAIAASRKAVVRALRVLRDDGVITTNRQQIVVLRPDTLMERAG
ncbi:Crp/Fnr family transcriptional regulator [Kutzneria buriramensis]|uniref:CRP-like cAMP-binding protein n=1 Tax=Kutzneria buriramensis TaxID=1045776 RepID=A0A3E0HB44_9PSEU|nr:Crp/Fnr family transcriptional regulator [Kutzneria buriramensis]REH41264.1 CRP-like cAMP-binding protein [Kutzneria buriramensis]